MSKNAVRREKNSHRSSLLKKHSGMPGQMRSTLPCTARAAGWSVEVDGGVEDDEEEEDEFELGALEVARGEIGGGGAEVDKVVGGDSLDG